MCMHYHRVLIEHGISPGEWAILSASSYFTPVLPLQLVIQARLGSEDDFSTDELKEAGMSCASRGWLTAGENGITLSDEGRQTCECIEQELMETVELL
ncbi:MAG: hypothetical protein QM703_07180 [Gemmatales bacterium]